MTKQRDPQLQEIVLASKACLEFTRGMDFELFEQDLKTSSAVQHQLLVIGEAVKRLPDEVKKLAPNIPWKNIAGTRDVLIHCYEEADYEIIWNIVRFQIADLIKNLEQLLEQIK